MNLLKPLRTTKINIDGKDYKIRYQFYYILEILKILDNKKLNEETKVTYILDYFYEKMPNNLEKAVKELFNFIGEGNYKTNLKSEPKEPDFSWDKDHQIIWASMTQVYGNSWKNWHWFEFKAAFDNLPQDSPINRVIEIRTQKIDPKMNIKEKQKIKELKDYYSLGEEKKETPKDIEERLLKEQNG